MLYRLFPLLFITWLASGCHSKPAEKASKCAASPPAFNVPALLGMDIDHVQAALGPPEQDSVADRASESTRLFCRDTVLLRVGYDAQTRKVHSYLIRTRHGQTSDYVPLLRLVNLTGQEPVLVVVPLPSPGNPAVYTGVKVFLKDGGGL